MERDLLSDAAAALAGTRALDEATASAVRDFLCRLKGDRAIDQAKTFVEAMKAKFFA